MAFGSEISQLAVSQSNNSDGEAQVWFLKCPETPAKDIRTSLNANGRACLIVPLHFCL